MKTNKQIQAFIKSFNIENSTPQQLQDSLRVLLGSLYFVKNLQQEVEVLINLLQNLDSNWQHKEVDLPPVSPYIVAKLLLNSVDKFKTMVLDLTGENNHD